MSWWPLNYKIIQKLVDPLPASVYRCSHICALSRYGWRAWVKALGTLFRQLKRLNNATMKSSPALQLSADISKELSWQISGKKKKKKKTWTQWVSGIHLHTIQINVWVFKMSQNFWNLDTCRQTTAYTKDMKSLAHMLEYCIYIQFEVCRWV